MTVTFDDVPMLCDTVPPDTVMVCLGLDCNTVYCAYDIPPVFPPPGCVGFSNFYATAIAAGLVWNFPDGTVFAAPQWGYFHGSLAYPSLLVAVPPEELRNDHEAVRGWFRDQVAAIPAEVADQVKARFAEIGQPATPPDPQG